MKPVSDVLRGHCSMPDMFHCIQSWSYPTIPSVNDGPRKAQTDYAMSLHTNGRPSMTIPKIPVLPTQWPLQASYESHMHIYIYVYAYIYIYILMLIIYTHHFCSWHVWTTVDERNPGPVGTVDGFIPWEFLYLQSFIGIPIVANWCKITSNRSASTDLCSGSP